MKKFVYKITDPLGIHARPAGMLARLARNYKAVCTVQGKGKTAKLSQLIQLMSIGIKHGDEIVITADGPDETEAILALSEFMKTNL